jgi:Pretoxin HINT domain
MVLLASGAAIPISQLRPGDKVEATNVKTGKTSAEPVTAVLLHHDTDLYDLTVKTSSGTSVIDTTRNHLFWDQTSGRWTKAAALSYGDKLRTADGAIATAAGGYIPAIASGWMWDLTVPGGNDHDFYIDTATAAVLVHNCNIRLDSTGKVHGELPGYVPSDMTTEQMEELESDLQQSISTRQAEQDALGEDGPHRARINDEIRFLRQIQNTLGGS